jgi:hypothetical protein
MRLWLHPASTGQAQDVEDLAAGAARLIAYVVNEHCSLLPRSLK